MRPEHSNPRAGGDRQGRLSVRERAVTAAGVIRDGCGRIRHRRACQVGAARPRRRVASARAASSGQRRRGLAARAALASNLMMLVAMLDVVYRSMMLGLVATAVLLLARPAPMVAPAAPTVATVASVPTGGVAVVDVARASVGAQVLELLGLAPGERVIAIDDRPGALEDVLAAWRAAAPGEFLDLAVAGPAGAVRRVLVLVHR